MTATPAADRAAPSSDPFVGQQAGGYVITRPLGEGGMGVVYEARHATLAQRAAVKVLRRELASSERDLLRFVNEARTVAAVQHPGIVKIFDIGQIDGTPFILMELLDGEPLHARLDRAPGRRLPLVQVLDFASQAAAALSFIHGRGFVHRDLKPDNMFLCPDPAARRGERVVLLDFGIAKFLDPKTDGGTAVGITLGTPHYMAPEQCEGRKDLTGKVDVYALGVLLFETLSGRLPFESDSPLAIMRQHMVMTAPPLSEIAPDTPPLLVELVASMLAKSPLQRPTMEEVGARLLLLLQPLTSTEMPPGLVRPSTLMSPSVPAGEAVPRGKQPLTLLRASLWLGLGFGVGLIAIGSLVLALRGPRRATMRTVPAARPVQAAVPVAAPPPSAVAAPTAPVPSTAPVPAPGPEAAADKTEGRRSDGKRGSDGRKSRKSKLNLARDRLD
ncbi:MAG: serine/threonine-protein kinase [Polyangia bacterium]